MKSVNNTLWQDWQVRLTDPATISYRSILLTLILLGLLLRLSAVYFAQGYHHFMVNDEVTALEYILAFLAGEEKAWYLAQPAFNSGKLPGPLWTLFGVMLFKLGGNSAEGALYWMAVVNSFAIPLIYLLAKRFFQPGMVLVIAAIYALAPWTIYYSYSLYNPVPLDLIGTLLFLALWQAVSAADSRQIFWVPLLCAGILQFHMIGLFVIPAVLLILVLSPVRLNQRWFVAGIMAGIMLYLPYIIGDLQHDWQNLKALATSQGDQAYSISALKIVTAPATILSSVPAGWTGDSLDSIKRFGNDWFGHYSVLVIFGVWTLIHSFIYLYYLVKKSLSVVMVQRHQLRKVMFVRQDIVFIGVLILVPLLLFILTGHNFSTRYSIVLFPLLFLLPGLFLRDIKHPIALKYWIYSLAFTGLCNLYLIGSYHAHQHQRFATSQEFMPSFRKLETIYQSVREDAGRGNRIDIKLSSAVNDLPHFENKLIYTIKHYISVFQRYQPVTVHGQVRKHYLVTLPQEESEGMPVYSDNSIVIRRLASD